MLALLITATLAGGCVSHGVGYGYAAPVYGYNRQVQVSYGATYQPVYQAPAYQAPTYQQPYQPSYDVKQVVGQLLREEYADQQKLNTELEIKTKLDRLEQLLAAPKQAPQPIAPQPQAPYFQAPVQIPAKASPQAQAPSPQYPLGYQPPQSSPSFGAVPPPPLAPGGGGDQAVAQILSNRCASCHTAPAVKGAGIVLLDPGGNLAPINAPLMLAIQEDVKTGKMPKGGPELPDNELSIISGWVGDHAAEVSAFLAQGLGR